MEPLIKHMSKGVNDEEEKMKKQVRDQIYNLLKCSPSGNTAPPSTATPPSVPRSTATPPSVPPSTATPPSVPPSTPALPSGSGSTPPSVPPSTAT